MLTPNEQLAVADCARNYPPGHGSDYFWNINRKDGRNRSAQGAFDAIMKDQKIAKYG